MSKRTRETFQTQSPSPGTHSSTSEFNEADAHYAIEEAEVTFRALENQEEGSWENPQLLYDIHQLHWEHPEEISRFWEGKKIAEALDQKRASIYNNLTAARKRVEELETDLAQAIQEWQAWDSARQVEAQHILNSLCYFRANDSSPSEGHSCSPDGSPGS